MLLVEAGEPSDIFDVVELTETTLLARSPFLFEIGEELKLRIERAGSISDATARIKNHRADGVSELELLDQSEPRRVVSG